MTDQVPDAGRRLGFGGRSWSLGLFAAAESGEFGFQLGESVLLLLEVGLFGVELGLAGFIIGKIRFGIEGVLIERKRTLGEIHVILQCGDLWFQSFHISFLLLCFIGG